jgi:NADH-quinone oxidoreductase subunit H
MISYELSMGLAVVGLLMVYQSVRMDGIVEAQGGALQFLGLALPLPNWGVFLQPLGFLLFLTAVFAETNRNPFDLAEGESELVAGYHVEYSSVKFALFFMAEYANMVGAAFLTATLFFGGYQVPFFPADRLVANPLGTLAALCLGLAAAGTAVSFLLYRRGRSQEKLQTGFRRMESFLLAGLAAGLALSALFVLLAAGLGAWTLPHWAPGVFSAALQLACLTLKVLFFCWLFVWVRWTLPRFRYDQLMTLGWKFMLPVALLNLLVTAVVLLLTKVGG